MKTPPRATAKPAEIREPGDLFWIGTNIHRLRTAQGLTQETLARQAGVTARALRSLENAETEVNPTLKTLGGIARALGVETAKLYRRRKVPVKVITTRAKRGSRTKFLRAMAKVGSREPGAPVQGTEKAARTRWGFEETSARHRIGISGESARGLHGQIQGTFGLALAERHVSNFGARTSSPCDGG